MKKFLIFCMSVLLFVGMAACFSSCKHNKQEPPPDIGYVSLGTTQGSLDVDNVISTDREYMFIHYGEDYRWYETCMVLTNYLDAETQDGSLTEVTNVFQSYDKVPSGGADTYVILAYHPAYGNAYLEVEHGFWIEDFTLNGEDIKVSFTEAFEKVMASNYVKPHSRHCVLRKQVGPILANPQYIFGNTHSQLYVDAVTGAVSDQNPAFNGSPFALPLGEWP